MKGSSRIDLEHTEKRLKAFLSDFPDRKCSVSLLHGDLSEGQMRALYEHDKVKCLVNIAHGEGFGLPLFEAARCALPIVTIPWSGQTDFLRHNNKNYFAAVSYVMNPIKPESVWQGVIEENAQWAYAEEGSYKMALQMVHERWDEYKEQAIELQDLIRKEFNTEKLYEGFCNAIIGRSNLEPVEIDAISFCIPTNGAKPDITKLTINSIKRELGEFPHEIIIAGDVENFKDIDGVTLVDKSEEAHSRRVASLRNAAGDASQYDTIAWLDDDVLLGKDWLNTTLAFSKQNGWSVLGNKVLLPDGGRYWDRATLNPHVLVSYDHPEYDRNLYQSSAFIMVRKDTFQKVRWNEECLVYADREGGTPEDVQYSLDLVQNGFKISFNENSVVWHNDDSYCEFENVCLKKDLITEKFGIDFFPGPTVEFEDLKYDS